VENGSRLKSLLPISSYCSLVHRKILGRPYIKEIGTYKLKYKQDDNTGKALLSGGRDATYVLFTELTSVSTDSTLIAINKPTIKSPQLIGLAGK